MAGLLSHVILAQVNPIYTVLMLHTGAIKYLHGLENFFRLCLIPPQPPQIEKSLIPH